MARKAVKIICFCMLVLMTGIPALAQNTKGDQPTPIKRDTRFKTPRQSPKKTARTAPRVRRQDDKPSKRAGAPQVKSRSRKGEQPGKPLRQMFSKSQPRDTQRPWKGDISGRRIQPRESSGRASNVYPQPNNINYSSNQLKRRMRYNENPNVKRVRRMQQEDRGKPKVGKPIRPTFHKSRPSERQRAWRGDITGRRIRDNRSAHVGRESDRNVPRLQPGRGVWGKNARVTPGRYTSRARSILSGRSFYANRSRQHPGFRRSNPSLSLNPNKKKSVAGERRIIPRSASGSFLRHRSINTWAHFKKPGRRRLPADRDLAGRKLRSKNYETARPEMGNVNLNLRRRAGGDRPYKGPSGGYVSRTKSGKAWKGDITHRAIRGGQSPQGRDRAFLGFLKGGGFRSATVPPGGKKAGKPLPGRTPGVGALGIGNYKGRIRSQRDFADQGERYSGNIRTEGRPLKGGGSISGRAWNNRGMPVQGRPPGLGSRGVGFSGNIRHSRGFNDQGEEYTGNIPSGKPVKGGGSISGRWNNGGMPIQVRPPGRGWKGMGYTGNIHKGRKGFNDQGEEYTGNIRTGGRPLKGGGSISGRAWNNRGMPVQGRPPGPAWNGMGYTGNIHTGRRGFNDQGEEYTGNIRTGGKPLKGGGSRSGMWNNRGVPIQGRPPGPAWKGMGYSGNIHTGRRGFNDQGEEYTGNIKTRRPDKGGGSVSGKLWNNQGNPIPVRTYAGQTRMNRYTGNIKARRPEKGGGSVSGEIWNNKERPIAGKDYSYARKMGSYQGNVRAKKSDKGRGQGFDFSGDVKYARGDYRVNPNSAEGALRGRKASAASLKADVALSNRRSWNYIRNPSSADEAQRTREPGRAFAQLTDFHGNIKVKRSDLFNKRDLHPDAAFVKLNKNNVPDEKDMFTNLKLWWTRLFRKSETQPDHLKERGGKPRYDKGEAGLWYE